MKQNKATSSTVLDIVNDSGHQVEAWWCDDEFTREEINPGKPMKLVFTANDDGKAGTCELRRVRDGEIIKTETVGQPTIDNLLKSRSWTVDKQ